MQLEQVQVAFSAAPEWLDASVPWLLGALVLAATIGAIGVWTLVARVRELQQVARRFDALEAIQAQVSKLVSDRGDLDLRRVEHVLLELRDAARRLEDSLLRATQTSRSSALAISGANAASLSDRVIDRLLAHGYVHVQIVTTLAELERIFDADGQVGEVLVEARHNGVLCKGRVLVRNGAVTEVELKPAYSMFP